MLGAPLTFSVIIPHLNQPEGLEKCLSSLSNQTLSPSAFEVIVVDNGSRSPLHSLAAKHPGVRFLEETTPGPGPARNLGAAAAKGSILAFIDADCRAHPEWLRIADETFSHSAPGTILGGDVRIVSDGEIANSGIEAYEKVFGFRFKLYVEEHGYSGTGNLVVRRADFEKVGPFVGIEFAEDVEWGGRARREGLKFRYAPELIVYHPARNSIRELYAKWDRHISHELTAARQKSRWQLRWIARASAVSISPLVDLVRPLTSGQIQGVGIRVRAVGILFNIRLYRGMRMFTSLGGAREILWNRDRLPIVDQKNQRQSSPLYMIGKEAGEEQNSPLVRYALRGLQACWLPEDCRWSHIYHLDGRNPPNESVPESDVFYTLNVLLGLSRVANVATAIDLKGVFEVNATQLVRLPVQKYAFGMALWASAELMIPLPETVLERIRFILSDRKGWLWFSAQDLGMILAGVASQARRDPPLWSGWADELFRYLVERYHCKSGLFFNNVFHLRRRYTSFATHTYLALACYVFGETFGRRDAIDLANTCVRKLIELQGPNGEWPWFFDTKKGTVVDFYEVYSVHQCGMAPALLEYAERHGVHEAHDALRRGFNWVFGENQKKHSMLVSNLGLIIRSQCRRGELNTKLFRALRGLSNAALSKGAVLADSRDVGLRLECRSYELGWMLWAFARREDLLEITNHPLFQSSTQLL